MGLPVRLGGPLNIHGVQICPTILSVQPEQGLFFTALRPRRSEYTPPMPSEGIRQDKRLGKGDIQNKKRRIEYVRN